MQERQVTVLEGASGKECKARLLVCPECDEGLFCCFFPDGIDHLHFQCASCGVSFCDGCTETGQSSIEP